MLTLFFTIVFLAELIVAGKIVSVIKQADANVCAINTQVCEIKPQLKKGMQSAASGVKAAANGVGLVNKFIDKRKRELYISLIKGILSIVIFIMIKKYPHKRCLTIVDVLFTFDNILKA